MQVYFEKRAIRICVGSYTKEFAFVTVFWEFNVKPKFTPKAKTTEIQSEIFQKVVVGDMTSSLLSMDMTNTSEASMATISFSALT